MVATTTTRTDEPIQRDVQDELKWDARLHRNPARNAWIDGVIGAALVLAALTTARQGTQS